MFRNRFCGSADHVVSRRGFLATATAAGAGMFADMTALQVLGSPAVAEDLRRNQKRCILLWLAGGSSQLETFDPKPGAATGGPFQSIQTTVPGLRICELMPKLAPKGWCKLHGIPECSLCNPSLSQTSSIPSVVVVED